jgi:hypothetical protein
MDEDHLGMLGTGDPPHEVDQVDQVDQVDRA